MCFKGLKVFCGVVDVVLHISTNVVLRTGAVINQ